MSYLVITRVSFQGRRGSVLCDDKRGHHDFPYDNRDTLSRQLWIVYETRLARAEVEKMNVWSCPALLRSMPPSSTQWIVSKVYLDSVGVYDRMA
jgi:hypothetical protein